MQAARLKTTRMVCKKCLVGGRVQGVFYRASAARRARELGISGYARNLTDGRVEVLACGSAQAVESFIGWLWVGPSGAKVNAVEVLEMKAEEQDEPQGFFTA
ncbi:MAG: acylphosphatase [Gammaproteobacteria bacterium]|nr:acylphosphatase [Gammaproteobacteria bacterium]MBV9619406.1 acylphosphatase [Gammaproteobacteria bacterium]